MFRMANFVKLGWGSGTGAEELAAFVSSIESDDAPVGEGVDDWLIGDW